MACFLQLIYLFLSYWALIFNFNLAFRSNFASAAIKFFYNLNHIPSVYKLSYEF